jgi:hypothetical protein
MVWKGLIGGVRFVGRLFVICLGVSILIALAGPSLFLVALFLYGAVKSLVQLDRATTVQASSPVTVDVRRQELFAALLDDDRELGAASAAAAPLPLRNRALPLRKAHRSVSIPRVVS